MAQKSETITVRLTPAELLALQVIGTSEQLGVGEVVRFLIRKEARQRKIWDEVVKQSQDDKLLA